MSDNHQHAPTEDLPHFKQFVEDVEDALGLESFDPNNSAYAQRDAVTVALSKLNNALFESADARKNSSTQDAQRQKTMRDQTIRGCLGRLQTSVKDLSDLLK